MNSNQYFQIFADFENLQIKPKNVGDNWPLASSVIKTPNYNINQF